MFYLLSKLLDKLLLPSYWMVFLLAAALLARRPQRRLGWLRAALVVFVLFTNPVIHNQAWLAWEAPPIPVAQVQQYDVGIVLSGITHRGKAPHDRVYFHHGADRVLHTVMLYKLGRFRHVVVTGGPATADTTDTSLPSEAEELRRVLVYCGVPDSVITVEGVSRNTRENALNTARILKRHPEWRRRLLITSGFHMRRASGCFHRVGVAHDTFPVDYITATPQPLDPLSALSPSEHAFYSWARLIREVSGYVVYRLMGYC